MIYLSQLLNQPVWDAFGHKVGKVKDILVNGTEKNMPPLAAMSLKNHMDNVEFIDMSQVATLWPSITLKVDQNKLTPFTPKGHELYLNQRVMDQQIVDTEGKRLVRVNDLQIGRKGEAFLLTGVDASTNGLFRRLGLESLNRALARTFKKEDKTQVIPWETVASIEHDDPLRLSVSQSRLVQMPPADIAAILDDLDHHTSKALLQGFTDEQLADTLEESSPEVQLTVLSHLHPERAADILEEMDPDEAADLLADMDDKASEQLLNLMEDEDEEDVRQLLGYPEDSAGGIMTTEFAHIPDNYTVEAALSYLRASDDALQDEFMFYVYILDEKERLKGVVSLRDLVTAPLDSPVSNWFDDDPVAVNPLETQEETAYLVAKYDLMAIPVVDPDTNKMLGIVTVDDALDTVLPTAWKKKLPRFAAR
ncbi:MAG: CBS domain-containing protein [Anaerolineaceae bacterium]|nr:CBS domain-containing protein [Anaerolineaceae bacterium]